MSYWIIKKHSRKLVPAHLILEVTATVIQTTDTVAMVKDAPLFLLAALLFPTVSTVHSASPLETMPHAVMKISFFQCYFVQVIHFSWFHIVIFTPELVFLTLLTVSREKHALRECYLSEVFQISALGWGGMWSLAQKGSLDYQFSGWCCIWGRRIPFLD